MLTLTVHTEMVKVSSVLDGKCATERSALRWRHVLSWRVTSQHYWNISTLQLTYSVTTTLFGDVDCVWRRCESMYCNGFKWIRIVFFLIESQFCFCLVANSLFRGGEERGRWYTCEWELWYLFVNDNRLGALFLMRWLV